LIGGWLTNGTDFGCEGPVIDLDVDLARYLAAVERGDRREAINVALAVVQRGVSAERVVTDLLARAQCEIGLGWQEGRWSVSMEHLASDITESALQVVVHHALSGPGAVREGSRGRVVVACGESEGHVLPGRMAADVLRLRGVDVTFIGPSVPAYDLAEFLGDDLPGAVALECSMPMSLVGAWRSISALRAIGMTIVCGGRGFGPDGRWGLALGADRWAPDFAAGADLVLSVLDDPAPAPREPAGAPERIAEVLILSREQQPLVEKAVRMALATWPQIRDSDAAIRATREELDATLQVIAAATLVGDLSLVTDYVRWFEAVLTGHGLPPALVTSAFELLLGVLPAELVHASDAAVCGLAARSTKPT
jgi:methanogenic corrinoid protein MtbC1